MPLNCNETPTSLPWFRKFSDVNDNSRSSRNVSGNHIYTVTQHVRKSCHNYSVDLDRMKRVFWKLVTLSTILSTGFLLRYMRFIAIFLLNIMSWGGMFVWNLKGWTEYCAQAWHALEISSSAFWCFGFAFSRWAHLIILNCLPGDGCIKCLWRLRISVLL